jgi:hypothetical protein
VRRRDMALVIFGNRMHRWVLRPPIIINTYIFYVKITGARIG